MTTLAVSAPAPVGTRAGQNWILDPVQDSLFIIVAPLLFLLLIVPAARFVPSGLQFVVATFLVFNVAHHLPTFIRIYGDVDLMKRFRWSFLLGPIIPFTFALAIGAYIIEQGYAIERLTFLMIVLSFWDPWHFLMQHYGFVRIYDRPNAAPRWLAARMDMALCATWFSYIMIAAVNWMPDMLYNLYLDSRIPVYRVFLSPVYLWFERGVLALALAATAAYAVYIVWCLRKGYFVSFAKLALCVITFGVMFAAYTPNHLILSLVPDWSFKVGFAVIGMVHVSQYMAIVWRFNRGLASRPGRARRGWFESLHTRGGWLAASIYVFVCLAYGKTLLADASWSDGLMAVLFALGFTSNLMHYYFDGFIWKVRHRENVENLAPAKPDDAVIDPEAKQGSWWDTFRGVSAGTMFLRQLVYFGVPMGVVTAGALVAWSNPVADHYYHIEHGNELMRVGQTGAAKEEFARAVAAIDRQLGVEEEIVRIRPTAAHYAFIGYLLYDKSQIENVAIADASTRHSDETVRRHRENIARAADALEMALALPGTVEHRGRSWLKRSDVEKSLKRWRMESYSAKATTARDRDLR